MEMNCCVRGSVMIVEFAGELDHHAASHVREEIDKMTDEYSVKHLVLDFKKVDFMDSSGIGIILGRYRRMGEHGGSLAIADCSLNVRNILNMAGVFSVVDYYGTSEEAVELLSRKEVS